LGRVIAGLILAGGRGSRFGGVDKALLPLAGRPLLDHVLARVRPQCDAVAVSANGDPGRFAAWAVPVVPDVGVQGPLSGLEAGLAWAEGVGATAMLSVPVDTPFVPEDLVVRLWPGPSCAVSSGRVHHLVALWPVAATRLALDALLAGPGGWAVGRLGQSLGSRVVEFAATQDPFLNLNTPADVAEAAGRLVSGRHGA
jgi:molybdenum cofactor guanylyltransferase